MEGVMDELGTADRPISNYWKQTGSSISFVKPRRLTSLNPAGLVPVHHGAVGNAVSLIYGRFPGFLPGASLVSSSPVGMDLGRPYRSYERPNPKYLAGSVRKT